MLAVTSDTMMYATILGLTEPWLVTEVELDQKVGEVTVFVAAAVDAKRPWCTDRTGPSAPPPHDLSVRSQLQLVD